MKFIAVKKTPLTEIGAGTVVPFTPRSETVTVLVPKGLATPDEVETMIVQGESLSDYGIHTSDVLAFRTNVTNRDVKPDSVCIVRILATGELLAKKVVKREGGKVVLKASGGNVKDRYLDADDIEVLGIVFAAQKLTDRFGRFQVHEDMPL